MVKMPAPCCKEYLSTAWIHVPKRRYHDHEYQTISIEACRKKSRRQAVRYVQNLGHVKDRKILVSREKAKRGWTIASIRLGRTANHAVVAQNMGV